MSGSLDKQRKAFKENPNNARAFEELEEHYFLRAEWKLLAGIYRHRLQADALRDDPRLAAPLVFRLAQIVEERLENAELALEHYKQCARLDPGYRPALQQLRRIHSSAGQWDVVIQIAEVENEAVMPPAERAEFLAEVGEAWLDQLGDPAEALNRFEEALQIDAAHVAALSGLARALETLGRHPDAVHAWEKLVASTQGIERAQPLVALGHLLAGPLEDRARAAECYRRALADDPRNEEAVCALIIDATAKEEWSSLADLYERRFDLAMGARRRSTVAIEAGHFHLEHLADPEAARRWFERATDLCPDDMAVQHSVAELARQSDDTPALLLALDRIIDLAGESAPASVLLEAADVHTSCGEHERAFELLTRARERSPDNPLVLDALCDSLAETNRVSELCEVLEIRARLAAEDRELQAEIYAELARRKLDEGDTEAARSAYELAFEADPSSPEAAPRLVELLTKAEAWSELESTLERARSEGPQAHRGDFHCALGELRLDRRDPEGAAEAFKEALAVSPDLPRAVRGLLQAAVSTGDEDAQIAAYELQARGPRDDDRHAVVIRKLSRLLEARGRTSEAIDWLETLQEEGRADRATLETIARLAALPAPGDASGAPHDRDRLIGALELLDEIIVRDEPDAFDASGANRQRLAALHAEAGRPEQAVHWYEASLLAEPDNADALLALREYYDPETRPDDRIRIERRLAEVLPEEEQRETLVALASLLEERSGDFDGAIDALRRLLEIDLAAESKDPSKSDAVGAHEERLERLLERAGRFESLVELLSERRSRTEEGPAARTLDLRRADLLLGRLERAEQACEIYRGILASDRDDAEAAKGLERATRMQDDPAALASLLAEFAETETDPVRRTALQFERATLLEGPLADSDGALLAFRSVLDAQANSQLADAAVQRIDTLLVKTEDFSGLRDFLEGQLRQLQETSTLEATLPSEAQSDAVRALRERLAALCRHRLSDTDGCIDQLEAVASSAPLDPRVWQELAALYKDLDRPSDLLRVTFALIDCDPPSGDEISLRARALALSLDRESPEGDRDAVEQAERVLSRDPGHAEAAELLCAHYEREERPADVARVLAARLRRLEEYEDDDSQPEDDVARSPDALARTALRLRISRIRSERLNDRSGAIEVLEPSLEHAELFTIVAEPLADLYESLGRNEPLAELCRRSAEATDNESARIRWQLRLGRALLAGSAEGDREESATRLYEEVLASQPQEPEARTHLRKIYRERGDHESLARLLEDDLALKPENELETLEELAPLLEQPLERPAAALPHWLRILEVEPTRNEAFQHALALSRELAEHQTQLGIIERRLQLDLRGERAMLLELRGDLFSSALDQPREALTEYRQALAAFATGPVPQGIETPQRRVRRSLRDALERLQFWPAFLACIDEELADPALSPDYRAAALERAAEVASQHVAPDAALPWLERLRALRPHDRDVVARIASLHRGAGRHHALLCALEDEISLLGPADAERCRLLRLERADIFEKQLGSPAAAASELESLRNGGPTHDSKLLEDLDRLFAVLGRDRERCEILEARLTLCDDAERRAETARLCSQACDDPMRAVGHWLHALSHDDLTRTRRVEWLNALADDLKRTGSWDAWTRAVEARLAEDDAHDGETSLAPEDRATLESSLGHAYAAYLGRSRSAARHWRAVLDIAQQSDLAGERTPVGEPGQRDALVELRDEAERELISQLREEGSALELEARLQSRLGRGAGDTEEWLELARLRLETLAAPAAAAVAYDEVLAREPGSRAALAGLRRAAEAVGDWSRVAETLEWELDRVETLAPEHRSGMARRLGDLRWRKLNQRDEAALAFAAALEAVPGDPQTLMAYAQLCEEREEWFEAVALLEDLVQSLGASEPGRCHDLWLRIARLSRDRCDDAQCAIQAYREAAELATLQPSDRRRWAELHRQAGEPEQFIEVFSQWCDDPAAEVRSSDLLTLATELEDLGRRAEALARVHQAQLMSEDDPAAWDLAARLERAAGHDFDAITALERAGELRGGHEAAERFNEAALLAEPRDNARACALLRRAAAADPGAAHLYARLATLEERLDRFEAAEHAAARALELDGAQDASADEGEGTQAPLPADLALACAIAGGRAARRRERLEAADRFFEEALKLEPQHPEALAAHGELLFERGDKEGARAVLERRLELFDDPDRASHLAMVGFGVLLAGDPEAATLLFAEALADAPGLDTAHSGLVQIHEEAGRIDEAVEALTNWAGHQQPEGRCQSLLQAAELELARNERSSALELLRSATEAWPASEQAWLTLCELAGPGRSSQDTSQDDALALSTQALNHVTTPKARARVGRVRASALEATGQREEALVALNEVLSMDPLSVETALDRGRVQRNLGRWGEAAASFSDFLSGLPSPPEQHDPQTVRNGNGADPDESEAGDPVPGIALIHRELGRLMAGPLEDIEEAIRCYERAVDLEPELSNVRDPLASLLTHFPQRWADAVHHHEQLLAEDPGRQTSIRCLLRIAKESRAKGGGGQETGLAILRALGTASPREVEEAPDSLPKRVVLHEQLSDEVWECARRLLLDASEDLAASSSSGNSHRPGGAPTEDSGEDLFGRAVATILRRLTGAAFADQSTDDIAATVRALVCVASGDVHNEGAPALALELDRQLGRRAHKRMRRTLQGVSADPVLALDFEAWRTGLRDLAIAIALDEAQGDLRGALLSLLQSGAGQDGEELDLCADGDISARVAGDGSALALLRRVVVGWATELGGQL